MASSFLVSASLSARAWRSFVHFLILLTNALVRCLRWDVLSVVGCALPKRSPKALTDYREAIGKAGKALEKARAVLGANQLRLSECRCKRDSARDTVKTAVAGGAQGTAKVHLRAVAEYDAEIEWLVQQEKAQLRNISDLTQAGNETLIYPTYPNQIQSGGARQDLVLLDDFVGITVGLANGVYERCEADIKTRIGQLEEDGALVVIDYQEGRGVTRVTGETIHDIREKIEAGQLDEVGVAKRAVVSAEATRFPSELLRIGWSRNYTAEMLDGRSVCSDAPEAVAWSMSGAVNQSLGVFSDQWQQYFKELARLLQERMTTALKGDALVYQWNRCVARSQKDVVAVAEEVERRLGMRHEQV